MGEIELNKHGELLIIHSHIITYGHAADAAITAMIREEIETMWNEPEAELKIRRTRNPRRRSQAEAATCQRHEPQARGAGYRPRSTAANPLGTAGSYQQKHQ